MDEKEINVAEKEVSTADPVTTAGEVVTNASPTETTTADDLTLAQTLIKIRNMITELVEGNEVRAEGSETIAEGSSKRAGEELEQESSKKQKLKEDKESEELKQCLEIILDDGDDLSMKKLESLKENIKFRGGLLGFKRLHDDLKVTAAKAAQREVVDRESARSRVRKRRRGGGLVEHGVNRVLG
ncbi:hypothetical protein Tco_1132858 [Tanacetum coccineum]|uniref:Uncharacterized protein n=1 Tax=Tanacetum coccineum TaxID=301880 RepID=A0ABQ5JD42_9ASTR